MYFKDDCENYPDGCDTCILTPECYEGSYGETGELSTEGDE